MSIVSYDANTSHFFFLKYRKSLQNQGQEENSFEFCRVHPSVLFASSLWNCHISFRKDDERQELGPADANETRPNLLFTWDLRGRVEGKSSELGPDFFYQCCVVVR